MLNILLKGHHYRYEVEELLKLFIEKSEMTFVDQEALVNHQSFLFVSELITDSEQIQCTAQFMQGDRILLKKNVSYQIKDVHPLEKEKMIKRGIKISIYDACSQFYHKIPPWGILIGVRPIKIVHELMDQGYDNKTIHQKLMEEYRIQNEKAELLIRIAQTQRPFILWNQDEWVSLYVSIPFCPTRCLYCSFPSNETGVVGENRISDYLKALHYEIRKIGKILRGLDRKVETLYIGGGTPTTLSSSQLDELLIELKQNMNMENIKEITVEAGRPDTITMDKLNIFKKHGVNRISINPQSMNPKTLERIGRTHSLEAFFEAYEMAQKVKFDTLNMDVIIGLPGESPEMFENTMREIACLKPENLTVHTLAIKRSSRLKAHIKEYTLASEMEAEEMLKVSRKYAEEMGMIPYYLYRQKYM
ncbi:MAG TPA: coproporphyrinogen dehydrogenase HemZ, partial [Clostridiales bacterium]|nr:coproporphyrinogen dehydrogenase HemZ [Clostridiales bacterium]